MVTVTIGLSLAPLLRPASAGLRRALGRTLRSVAIGTLRRRATSAVAAAKTLALAQGRNPRGGQTFLARRAGASARLISADVGQTPNLAHLGLIEIDKQAAAQTSRQHHAAIADTDQPAHAEPDLVEKLAHLAIATFGDHHAVPVVDAFAATVFNRLEACALTVDLDAIEQAVARLDLERSEHAHSVLTLDTEARVHQLVGQFARVGEQQQAFGVDVEPPHRLPLALRKPGQAPEHRWPVLRVVIGNDFAHRLVVGDHARWRWRNAHLDQLAGNADAVAE